MAAKAHTSQAEFCQSLNAIMKGQGTVKSEAARLGIQQNAFNVRVSQWRKKLAKQGIILPKPLNPNAKVGGGKKLDGVAIAESLGLVVPSDETAEDETSETTGEVVE